MKTLIATALAFMAGTAHGQTEDEALKLGRQTIAYLECAGLTLDMAKAEAFQEKGLVAGRAYLTYAQNKGSYPKGLPLSTSMYLDTLSGPTLDFRLGQLQMLLISSLSHENELAVKVDWQVRMKALYQDRNCDLLK